MKRAIALFLVLTLLMLALVGMRSAELVMAEPDALAESPVITIVSPENKTQATNNITLFFDVRVGNVIDSRINSSELLSMVNINAVYYLGDWQQNRTYVDGENKTYGDFKRIVVQSLAFSCDLTGVPEGNHVILVQATEEVPNPDLLFLPVEYTSYEFVNFTIDTTPPSVLILSPEASTYDTSEVPLDFAVNESFSQVAYSLDGQGNVTVSGNMTLTGLADGAHNIVVYAWDVGGNVGASETVHFSIKQPEAFPTLLVVAIVVIVVVVCLLLLLYLRRRRRYGYSGQF
jgi:hypothetical protein